ncbi:MAG: hypothetical protein EP321_09905 [Sphingomonadales bacterium]|nr:MAG: hypothetical protein EP345_11760 [Sphingomonadales bacterium]TNF03520.1 MAG: hypothetical protein EP321_09905 [Sphingomonadales bacterium]
MPYRIRFEGSGTTVVCAHSQPDALLIARDLIRRGRKNVVISTPDGGRLIADPHLSVMPTSEGPAPMDCR